MEATWEWRSFLLLIPFNEVASVDRFASLVQTVVSSMYRITMQRFVGIMLDYLGK